MSAELRLSRLASQLYGDLAAVDEIVRDDRHAAEQQKIQLILDAFEQVGVIALEVSPEGGHSGYIPSPSSFNTD